MQSSAEKIWVAAQEQLRSMLTGDTYNLWFAPLRASAQEDNSITLEVANDFCEVWLKDNYMVLLQEVIALASGRQLQVKFKVGSGSSSARPAAQPTSARKKAAEPIPEQAAVNQEPGFNPKNTFDTFVVGNNNNFSYAAALAVAQSPGKSYNPLFLYGGVGLGKTHLLHAIGHHVAAHKKGARVAYLSSEKFTNEYIDGIQNNQLARFRKKYRLTDVLLIDDIQFLAGKEGTQEEFFHTFNALHQANKQIVITSDRPPKSIPALEARLISRFEWGMVADIAQPDLETRVAILEAKCREKNCRLSQDIVQYIASAVHSNVRELEGALNRLMAFHNLNNTPPTLDSAKTLLSSLAAGPKRGGLTAKQIITTVAQFFDVAIDDLSGSSRKKELVTPRQISMYFLREELQASFPSIGHELGGRDHTTAMHAVSKITNNVQRDEKLKQDLALIKQRLYGG